jgi:hypothetical protein
MDNFDVSIIKYLGKVANGVLTLLSITFFEDKFTFDATFFYTDKHMLLTIPIEVEKKIGDIKKHPDYAKIIEMCIKKVVPYNEMIDRIDPLDVKPYLEAIFPNENFE